MRNKFNYKRLLDNLARSNFVWINYNREESVSNLSNLQQLEVRLNIPN